MLTRSVVLAAFALAPAVVQSQVARDTARIAPVVVTATRTPLSLSQSPSAVTVLSGDQLQRSGITTVVDALREVPGLAVVQSGGYGGATSVFIRGGESKFAKVLVDGVAVNDPGGSFDFSTLTTDNVERIEIVRGPASVLYGSDAMAGVIQLFTRRGQGAPRISLSARGGGYETFDGDAGVRGMLESFDYSIAGARHRTGGIQPFNSAFAQNVGSASLGWRSVAADARLTARVTDDNLHFATNGSGEPVDSNAVRRDGRLALGFDAGYRLAPSVDLRIALASSSLHAITDNQPDSPGDKNDYYYTTGDRGYRRSAELRANLMLNELVSATIGGLLERQWQTSATTSNFGPSDYTARRNNSAAFAQLLVGGSQALTATIGARYDHSQTFGEFFTYRLAASYAVAEGTRLRASFGTAFREPTMLENFGGGFVIGNPALSPEQAHSADVGIEQQFANLGSLSVTYFNNSFSNLIDYKYSATQPNYFNVARTRSSGVEVEGHAVLPSSFFADAALTYTSARVVDPGTSAAATAAFAPGARLLRRPMHAIDAGLAYRPSRLSAELRVHRSGTRQDIYFAPDFTSARVTLPAYVRTEASVDIPVFSEQSRSASVTLRAENLFDVRYMELAGYNYDFARSDDASVTHSGYRAPGRRILAGMRIQL